jgi:hypothetical protein
MEKNKYQLMWETLREYVMSGTCLNVPEIAVKISELEKMFNKDNYPLCSYVPGERMIVTSARGLKKGDIVVTKEGREYELDHFLYERDEGAYWRISRCVGSGVLLEMKETFTDKKGD